ncbi:helix-turn-helix domain-containing protein [Rhizocola hellebori]|uniref:helix-turn-helix domain-containing protein n=1 Tax=Rhizocola hellebori TaxID=1392758 RepID=UPI001EF241DD|nr:helix-turn-helix transcriptional regulator [Rhizocola hellebori]
MTHQEESPSDDSVGLVGETLRRARQHRGWSLREVERRTGRPNAYLSQVERGVIRQPDPALVWELAQLYELDFTLLAQWLGVGGEDLDDATPDVTGRIIRLVLNLSAEQKLHALGLLEQLNREDRT